MMLVFFSNARGTAPVLLAACLAGVCLTATSLPAAGGKASARQFPDREIVTDLTRLHVYKQTGIEEKRLRVRVEALSGGYARTRVATTDGSTDPAKVYLKKVGSAWKVIAGPGTSFSSRELTRLGVPRAVR
jgi:hypothetical protein